MKLGGRDVYTAAFDPQTGTLVAPPSRVAQRFIGTNGDPDWSPDGRQLAYVSERALPTIRIGAQVLCIADLESGRQRELPLSLGFVSRPRWSPDGRSILFRANDEQGRLTLFLADVDTARVRALVRRPGLQWARWSPDGQTVFILSNDGGRVSWIAALDLKTGQENELFREDPGQPVGDALVNDLSVSADGHFLAFTVLRNKVKIVMTMDSKGGEPHEIFRSTSDFQIANFAGLAWMPNGKEIVLAKAAGKGEQELWALPAQGGQLRTLGLHMSALSRPTLRPDGQQLAFQAGVGAWEIWALDNLQRQIP